MDNSASVTNPILEYDSYITYIRYSNFPDQENVTIEMVINGEEYDLRVIHNTVVTADTHYWINEQPASEDEVLDVLDKARDAIANTIDNSTALPVIQYLLNQLQPLDEQNNKDISRNSRFKRLEL